METGVQNQTSFPRHYQQHANWATRRWVEWNEYDKKGFICFGEMPALAN